jgi:hypothetical protein
MQKTINQEKTQSLSNESLYLTSRKSLKLEGIVEICATSDTNINLKLQDTSLQIYGNNISIFRLDVEQGILEANGNFDCIKYGNSGNIFKRIFK